jgi:dephospho-CoA kinase
MAAYAKLNLPAIDAALQRSSVVVDGLYSWEEYKLLKEHYGEDLLVVAVYSSPKTRQKRLPRRDIRPLTPEESAIRDFNEIENLGKGGPIAIADFTLVNESSIEELRRETEQLIGKLV